MDWLTFKISILHYLEETRPGRPLLPADVIKRSKVREICEVIGSGIQPLQNLTVLIYVGEEKKKEWAQHWITRGFRAVEKLLSVSAGKFCVGDEISMADCCLVPQVFNARRLVNFSFFLHVLQAVCFFQVSRWFTTVSHHSPNWQRAGKPSCFHSSPSIQSTWLPCRSCQMNVMCQIIIYIRCLYIGERILLDSDHSDQFKLKFGSFVCRILWVKYKSGYETVPIEYCSIFLLNCSDELQNLHFLGDWMSKTEMVNYWCTLH